MDQATGAPVVANRTAARVTIIGYNAFLLLGWSSILIPALVGSIESTFGRSDRSIALVYLIAALLYAAGSLGGGVVAERIGARSVLSGAVALLGVGLIVQGTAPVWIVFVAAAAIAKGGAGAIDGGVQGVFLGLQTDTLARSGALNRLHLSYGLGALAGPAAVGVVISLGGSWNGIFVVSGAMLLALAAAIVATPGLPSGSQQNPRSARVAVASPFEQSLRPFVWLAIAIACYEGAAMGVASWLVRFLGDSSTGFATAGLSLYWAGISLSRLSAGRLNRLATPALFTSACVLLGSLALTGAVLIPSTIGAIALFGASGFFTGPVYPMLMAIGGDLYPKRLAALSGALSASATAGAVVYPPLMGLLSASNGLRAGFLGAAALGIPTIGAIYAAHTARIRVERTAAA